MVSQEARKTVTRLALLKSWNAKGIGEWDIAIHRLMENRVIVSNTGMRRLESIAGEVEPMLFCFPFLLLLGTHSWQCSQADG